MSVMDFMGAGPPQEPPAEAISPDPAAVGPAGPPAGPPPEEGGGHDHEAMIRDLLDLARQVAVEADDDEEAADFEKVTSIIANILAKQQKQRMGLLKGANDPAALARVLGG